MGCLGFRALIEGVGGMIAESRNRAFGEAAFFHPSL